VNTTRKIQIARQFRKAPTDSEEMIWEALRNRRFMGFKFRRQYIIQGYILDFFCSDINLAIEIDGSIHKKQKNDDNRREEIISQSRIVFYRIPSELVEQNLQGILSDLASFIHVHWPSPLPPLPQVGEGDWSPLS
jgi:very-short-patch-repair endonuclease